MQQVLQAAEARALADREAAAPLAGGFEGGGAALTALLIVVLISSIASLCAWFLVEESRPELGS